MGTLGTNSRAPFCRQRQGVVTAEPPTSCAGAIDKALGVHYTCGAVHSSYRSEFLWSLLTLVTTNRIACSTQHVSHWLTFATVALRSLTSRRSLPAQSPEPFPELFAIAREVLWRSWPAAMTSSYEAMSLALVKHGNTPALQIHTPSRAFMDDQPAAARGNSVSTVQCQRGEAYGQASIGAETSLDVALWTAPESWKRQ